MRWWLKKVKLPSERVAWRYRNAEDDRETTLRILVYVPTPLPEGPVGYVFFCSAEKPCRDRRKPPRKLGSFNGMLTADSPREIRRLALRMARAARLL